MVLVSRTHLAFLLSASCNLSLRSITPVGLGILVSTDNVEGVDEQRLDAALQQVVGHHVCAHYLALCQDDLLLEGSAFLPCFM